MPEIIQFKNGNQIRNLYDAGGQKLNALYSTLGTPVVIPVNTIGNLGDPNNCNDYLNGTDYVGNIEYTFSNDCGDYQFDLSKIYNSEGYIDNFYYTIFNYYRRDHLGNNREVWRALWSYGSTNYAATTIQRTQYYPSGLPWASNSGDNPWMQNKKYNGKEFVEMHGYDVSDLGWRTDYNAINRFTTRDRKAEQFPWQSPYCVANNNTVRFVDKKGENAGDPESGGTPTTQTAKKTTEAQSTARRDVPEKIKPIKAPVALVQKTQAAAFAKGAKLNQGTLSKAPSNLERYMNVVSSPQDQLVAKNPVIQVTAVAVAVNVAAPAIIATGNTTALAVEGSAAISFITGMAEGVLKSGVIKSIGDTPPDLPYLFENPVHKVTSDATQGAIYFFNTSAK